MTSPLVKTDSNYHSALSPITLADLDRIQSSIGLVQQAIKTVLKVNIHYGIVPGTGNNAKPTLFKPGADILCSLFHFTVSYDFKVDALDNGHREYLATCTINDRNGQKLGEGIGSATTLEKKYRYMVGSGEVTDVPVPKEYWDNWKTDPSLAEGILIKAANTAGLTGTKFGKKKDEKGKMWMITTFGERVENDCIADKYNTCLKMAAKRAQIAAVLTVTGASAAFTQDFDDFSDKVINAEYSILDADDIQPPTEEDLLAELLEKCGLDEADKIQLKSFVEQTAAVQQKSHSDLMSDALYYPDSFKKAFSDWFAKLKKEDSGAKLKEQKAPLKDPKSVKEDVPSSTTNDITRPTREAVESELKRLGGSNSLPPDLAAIYQTGDPSELTEKEGLDVLKALKAMKE